MRLNVVESGSTTPASRSGVEFAGSAGSTSPSAVGPSSPGAVLVQELQSMIMARPPTGDVGTATSIAGVLQTLGCMLCELCELRALRTLDVARAELENEPRAVVRPEGTPEWPLARTKPRSFSRFNVSIFSCAAAALSLSRRSRVSSTSIFATLMRAFASASRLHRRLSSRAICWAISATSSSAGLLSGKTSGWCSNARCGNCSVAFSSKKYFSRKDGRLNPSLPASEVGALWTPFDRFSRLSRTNDVLEALEALGKSLAL
mmetsp:Transcript_110147/g.310561  ORF Transcript_110147/g.310561 Transcript_110147/m.310561 type:complete len:261 (+) Transcript_110147:1581-2363(+)